MTSKSQTENESPEAILLEKIRKIRFLESTYLDLSIHSGANKDKRFNIQELPSEIGELPLLEGIRIDNIGLKRLPSEIGNLKKSTSSYYC